MKIADRVAVRCSAVVLRADHILLCHRPDSDVWVLPGGRPRRTEGAVECARREVLHETGIEIDPGGVAFVLDATSPRGDVHLFEIVLLADEHDPGVQPTCRQEHLVPEFVPVDTLAGLAVRPPIAGRLSELARALASPADGGRPTIPYLGNLWRQG